MDDAEELRVHMDQKPPMPRFRKPPVSEVVLGIQFQAPLLTPVHLGLYYQRVRDRFPDTAVHHPLQPIFETFEPQMPMFPPFPLGIEIVPRMWFGSRDGSSLIQLQSGRLNFNWRGGLEGNTYPHFSAVQSEFSNALNDLHAVCESEGLGDIVVNQCELVYVNPLPCSVTGVALSEPQKIFRILSGSQDKAWSYAPEDISFVTRFKFSDESGVPFGRLTVSLTSGAAANGTPAFQLEMTARGRPLGGGNEGIGAFHDYAHEAIVRCFAAITTQEMHERWERYQ